jgi:hypothetical protein
METQNVIKNVIKHFSATSILCLFCVSFQAQADILDVNLSNDAVAINYLIDMGQGFYAGGGALHEEDSGQLLSLDLMVRDDLRSGEHAFTAGVGGKLFGVFTEGDGGDGGSLTLGGFANYTFPSLKALALHGEVFYGPSVTSTNDLEGLLWYIAGVELEVIERAMLHAGYRKVRAKYEAGSFDLDEGMHVGVRLEF